MDPKVSRGGWFRSVFGALLAGGMRPVAGAVTAAIGPTRAPADFPPPQGEAFVVGQTITTTYDADGRVLRVDADGPVLTYAYHGAGRLCG